MKLLYTSLLACLLPGTMAGQLPTQKLLTLDVAMAIAQETRTQCHDKGYHISVTVVDARNGLLVFLRDEVVPLSSIEVGQMKATSAIKLGRPSGPPPDLPVGQPVPAPIVPGTVNLLGGIPIIVDKQIIGAVAVSGAPGGDKDAACAIAALGKLSDKLR